jgi:hypothetical protein
MTNIIEASTLTRSEGSKEKEYNMKKTTNKRHGHTREHLKAGRPTYKQSQHLKRSKNKITTTPRGSRSDN